MASMLANAENFYYLKQMQSKTSMSIVLRDGEVLKGVIEWYDKDRLTGGRRDRQPLIDRKEFPAPEAVASQLALRAET
jgi:hypothetical protein